MPSSFTKIPTEQSIPYYEETQKRTLFQKLCKIKNTSLMLIAYALPSNGLRIRIHRLRGVSIGKNVYIGMFCFLDNLYPHYIFIGDNVSINAGSMIVTHFNPMKQFAPIFKARVAPVVINNKAIIAVKSILLPGVTIGECAIVSAASVVDKNVEPFTLVRGNPAKKVLDYELLIKENN